MNSSSTPVPYPGSLSVTGAAAHTPGMIMPVGDYAIGTHVTREIANLAYNAVMLIVDVNNVNTTGDLTITIETIDPVSGAWASIFVLPFDNIAVVGQTVLFSAHEQYNVAQTGSYRVFLPVRWRLSVVVADAIVNFSVSAFYVQA